MKIKKRLKLAFKRAKAEGWTPTLFRLHPEDAAQFAKDIDDCHPPPIGQAVSRQPPPPDGPITYVGVAIEADLAVELGTVAAYAQSPVPGTCIMGEVDLELDAAWDSYRESRHNPNTPIDSELAHANGFKAGAVYGARRAVADAKAMFGRALEVGRTLTELAEGFATNAFNAAKAAKAFDAAITTPTGPTPEDKDEPPPAGSQLEQGVDALETFTASQAKIRGEIVDLVGKACDLAMDLEEVDGGKHGRELQAAKEILFALYMDIGDNGIDRPFAVIADALADQRREAE